MSPQSPDARSADKSILVQLEGDLMTATAPNELSSLYLFVPSSPVTDPVVQAGMSAAMFIDKSLVTLDGTECNKIGVSYSAFRNQPNPCQQYVGSCLSNQLQTYYQSDLAAAAAGLPGRYLISNWGVFQVTNSGQRSLVYLPRTTQNSVLVVTLNADSLVYIVNL